MLENVTYEFYTEELGRNAVPDAETFESLALYNRQFVENLAEDGLIVERQVNGMDKAVCMMIEEEYLSRKSGEADGKAKTSISIDGYSESYDVSAKKSLESMRMSWLRVWCLVTPGVL